MTATPTTTRPHTTSATTTARVLVLGTALAIGLTGCTGGGGGGEDAGGSGDATQAGGDAASTSEETPLGAVDKFYEAIYGDVSSDAGTAELMAVEEATARCMTEQGFEYIPRDWGAMLGEDDSPRPEVDGPAWGTLEFAQQWGYGITTDSSPDSEETDASTAEEYVDPNTAITDAMSESELAAYYKALTGPYYGEEVSEATMAAMTWKDMGCNGYAEHEVNGDSAMGGENPHQGLIDEINAMRASVDEDPRVVAAAAEWSGCMADAGHPNLAAVGDAEQSVLDQVEPIFDSVYGPLAEGATEAETAAADAAYAEQEAAFRDEEIALATADYTCRDEVGYDDVHDEANLEVQQTFYDEHKTELEEWAASVK